MEEVKFVIYTFIHVQVFFSTAPTSEGDASSISMMENSSQAIARQRAIVFLIREKVVLQTKTNQTGQHSSLNPYLREAPSKLFLTNKTKFLAFEKHEIYRTKILHRKHTVYFMLNIS